MKLLYLNEHLSCLNYQVKSDAGFVSYKLEKGDIYQIDNSKSACGLFLISGEISLNLGMSPEIRITQKEMIFIPQNVEAHIEALIASKCILLFWDKNVNACDKFFLASLPTRKLTTDIGNPILPIKRALMVVLDSVSSYLEAKLLCRHMHSLKQQELLLVLKGFYTKKELATFFSASTGIRQHFERFVLENYKKVNSVKEFADLYYISERSFSREFHSCFGESPYKWMQKKKAERIREMISDPQFTLQEIAVKFEFSSPSHFTAYCRRLFGVPPSQLREYHEKQQE